MDDDDIYKTNLHMEPCYFYSRRAEKSYDKNKFDGNVSDYPFQDHQVPQLSMMQQFCQDAAGWLDQNSENVVVVHCKAGKGRTGVMIAALLLYTHQAKDAEDAVCMYGKKRTINGMVSRIGKRGME